MAISDVASAIDSTSATKFIEEISIILAAQDLTPTIMSQDFLKFSGIVPKDWELAQQPVLNPNFAQLNFKNGVSLTAQPRTITISESISGKNLESISIPQIAVKYLEKLPHAEYMGLSFSPKILVPFPNSPESARQYITGTLLGSGSWKEIGEIPVQAGINLMYVLGKCQLTINIAEARLQHPEKPSMAALLFSGSFNYNINNGDSQEHKVSQLTGFLNYWQTDLEEFRQIVTEKFLNSDNSAWGQSIGEATLFPGQTL